MSPSTISKYENIEMAILEDFINFTSLASGSHIISSGPEFNNARVHYYLTAEIDVATVLKKLI